MAKIDRLNAGNTHPAHENSRAGKVNSSAQNQDEVKRQEAAGSRDRATVSEEARMLSKLHNALNVAPDTRAEKVAEVKKQLDDGTYSFSPEELAQRLLPKIISFD